MVKANPNPSYTVGEKVDSLNGVYVYYNGGVGNIQGRNIGKDGYNLGLKYQCVEFVKRYYYKHYHHKMPDSYGNAKDFFNPILKDSSENKQRNLVQFTNPSATKPASGDLIVFDGHSGNRFGHVAIVADVQDNSVVIIQQNPGPFSPSRESISLSYKNGKWSIEHERILGWLRMKEQKLTNVFHVEQTK